MDFSYLDEWMEEEAGAAVEEAGEGYRNIWVVAETCLPPAHGGAGGGSHLSPTSLEAMAPARDLADQIGCYVYGVVLGHGVEEAAAELVSYGADKVLLVDDSALADYQPETYTQALADLVARFRPEIVLLAATPLGNDLAPRLAQRLDTGLISHCIRLDLDMSERLLLGTFGVLGGEVRHTVACPEARPQMATLQPGCFRAPAANSSRSGDVQRVEVDLGDAAGRLVWRDMEVKVALDPLPLSKAKVVVAGGRGLGDAEGFALVRELAGALGGAVAGSRGALDEGWIGEEQVVGVGGESIAPDLYVACGLSGDVYHAFGLQNARAIVAINSDPTAPIAKMAHMIALGDARQIIPAMLRALAQE